MRLLLDDSFPAGTEMRSRQTVRLEGWKDPGHPSDSEALEIASRAGFDGMVFMGRDNLASPALLETAIECKLGVVITHADEPVAAEDALADQLEHVAAKVGPGRVVLVLSSEIRSWNAKELLEKVRRP